MPTLVIQLGRLGDVIQTTPLLQELSRQSGMKCSYSETAERIELLVVQPNQEGLRGFKALSAIRTVGEDLKSLDDQIARGFRHGAIPDEARRLLARLNLPRYHRVINASHAALGCWLAGEIPCDAREGGIINREGASVFTR
jgi:ADP-heptose:LPS heptosyltransferase